MAIRTGRALYEGATPTHAAGSAAASSAAGTGALLSPSSLSEAELAALERVADALAREAAREAWRALDGEGPQSSQPAMRAATRAALLPGRGLALQCQLRKNPQERAKLTELN